MQQRSAAQFNALFEPVGVIIDNHSALHTNFRIPETNPRLGACVHWDTAVGI